MPELRHGRFPRRDITVQVKSAAVDRADQKARERAGKPGPRVVEVRNGMPEFKPYVYRGDQPEPRTSSGELPGEPEPE